MINCTVVDFDGNELGNIKTATLPDTNDLLIVGNTPYMVYARQFHTIKLDLGPLPVMAEGYIVNSVTLTCITEQAATPDHDYMHGGYVKDKYSVKKADGTPTDPYANYFVLRLDTDPNALTALKVYADSVQSNGNALLAEDLRNIIKNMREYQKRVDLDK